MKISVPPPKKAELVGPDLVNMECCVRGVRNPALRKTATGRAPTTTNTYQPLTCDDGTRVIKIVGCE